MFKTINPDSTTRHETPYTAARAVRAGGIVLRLAGRSIRPVVIAFFDEAAGHVATTSNASDFEAEAINAVPR